MLKGILFSIVASSTFGLLYFYAPLLTAFDSEQIFAWRILLTIPFVSILIWYLGELQQIRDIWLRIKQQPTFFLLLIVSSILCAFQLWLFLWAPIHGRGLQVSLGYFLLPLTLVLSGCLIFKEKLSKLQLIAVIFACLGVFHEFWRIGSIAWETLSVAVGYTAYFILRKKMHTNHLSGFFWDLIIISPIAAYLIFNFEIMNIMLSQPILWLTVTGLGILSTVGLGSYILASRYLPLTLFGLLSYLEPILLALASLVLGEKIKADEWFTYIPIWFAVGILMYEGSLHLYRQRMLFKRNV